MNNTELPNLTAEEIRVLGALIEKGRTTPDYYPMTINGLTNACNQKSARKPVVDYTEEIVANTLKTLRAKGLVATETGGTSRTIKYRHCFSSAYDLNPACISIMCLLFLRGPLTPGEINSNSNRLYDFESLEAILKELDFLQSGEIKFIDLLPKQAGQKEARYIQLFSEYVPEIEQEVKKSDSNLEARIEILESELADLKENFQKLLKELMG